MNNASHTTSCWSDEQVELFHDQELPAELAARFESDLRSDGSLQRRLASVSSLDRAVRRELLTAPVPRSAPGRGRAWLAVLGTAALAAAVIVAAIWPAPVARPAGTGREGPPAGPIASAKGLRTDLIGDQNLEQPGEEVLASLSVPVKRSAAGAPPRVRPQRAKPSLLSPEISSPAEPPLGDLLASGDVDGFLAQLRRTPLEQRDAAFGLLGGTLRSALTAEGVLDRLTPEEQLAVCSVWAREPHLRPVTFARLAALQTNIELRDRVADLVGQLSESRELLAWVRSYGLRAHPSEGLAG
jgi:hypothetical protein